jgi:hypothetical protein
MVFQIAREVFQEEFSNAHAQPAWSEAYYDNIVESLMPVRIWLRLTELAVVAGLVAALLVSWRADRRDRAQLATQLAAAQQTIAAAADRQKDRDAQLTQTLAQLARERKSARTPEQILKALPYALALPEPITGKTVGARFSLPRGTKGASPTTSPDGSANTRPSGQAQPANLPTNPTPKTLTAPDAILPSADLKPLYDFALDCQACRAKLAAAQNDLVDEKTKSASLTKERDAALRVAKGGSALRRIARAAKWFLVGAAAGAIAAKATHYY